MVMGIPSLMLSQGLDRGDDAIGDPINRHTVFLLFSFLLAFIFCTFILFETLSCI